jgi:hypothetical protein
MQAISRIDRSWPRRARILLPALVAIAFVGVVAGCGSKSKSPSTPASTALPTTTTTATTVAKKKTAPKLPTKIPASAAPQAKAYIAAHSADLKLVVRYESDVQTAVAEVVNSPLMTPLQQSTQTALDNISKVLPKFHGPYKQDALGLTEQQIAKQANGVGASMKTLLEYVAFPTPATLNEYTTQYQNVVLAWNKAVKAIWTVAKALKPPTICTTC